MKGFVPTPPAVVDLMVEKLFSERPPTATDTVLDPRCGAGAFVEGIIRWCDKAGVSLPRIVGVDSDPKHIRTCRKRFGGIEEIQIRRADFLRDRREQYDYIIGNPPYVPITALTEAERDEYRRSYKSATGRFDLYILFWEQALRQLAPDGRLVFITPEKFLYVKTAEPLRELLAKRALAELHFVDEATFGPLVTYPLITTLDNKQPSGPTSVRLRDGQQLRVTFPDPKQSWLPSALGATAHVEPGAVLSDIALRVSCGVATGADGVFTIKKRQLAPSLRKYAHPTVAGRQLTLADGLNPEDVLLIPYDSSGRLLREDKLGFLGRYLSDPDRREKLEARTCVVRKPWYAFHENPPLRDIKRPKILCKDITAEPFFVADYTGEIVPRHSVYYIVPTDESLLAELTAHLNSDFVREWLFGHCQRAANGFLRLQSHVLKRIPIPASFASPAHQRKLSA